MIPRERAAIYDFLSAHDGSFARGHPCHVEPKRVLLSDPMSWCTPAYGDAYTPSLVGALKVFMQFRILFCGAKRFSPEGRASALSPPQPL